MDAAHWAQAVARWLDGLEWHRAGDRHVLRLHLTPAHLGPLHVEVLGDGNVLTARITVFHPDTLSLVQRHVDELRQALVDRGYQLAGLEVGLGGPGGQPGQPGAGEPERYPASGWIRSSGTVASPVVPEVGFATGRRPPAPALGAARLDVRI